MSDPYGYDPYGAQPRLLGYDEYGRPVYQQEAPPQQVQRQDYDQGRYEGQDPYGAAHTGQQPPVYDPYAARDTGQQPPVYDPYAAGDTGQQPPVYDPYREQGPPPGHPGHPGPHGGAPRQGYADGGYDPYGPAGDTGGFQPGYDPYGPAADTGGHVPAQAPPPPAERYPQEAWQPPGAASGPPAPAPIPPQATGPGSARTVGRNPARNAAGEEYHTEQFAFVEEGSDDSEDVIDWLKFSESRTERREEAKRRGRNRKKFLLVLLVLAVLGGTGYLWQSGRLPGLGSTPGADAPVAGEQRDVLVVHLRPTNGDSASTALLIDNATTERGATLLLPNTLAVSTADGATTTLGSSVEDEGATPTRDALDKLLGAETKGTWRLDTPYLEILVDSVGGVSVDTDTEVPARKKGDDPLVKAGPGQDLDGQAAVAYATRLGPGEQQAKQLARFGQVMQAVLKKLPTDRSTVTGTVRALGQILDPSLSEESLGATLAHLAERAKDGAYATKVLPVEGDGTLSEATSDGLVKEILGGTVKNSDPSATPRVSVRNASGDAGAADTARVALVNGGYTVVGSGSGSLVQPASRVLYTDPEQKAKAEQVAKTLGLPDGSVRQGKGAANADVTVVLGQDYDG